jgi:eukaryotic-like serine/threonine-protein kinase
MTTTMFQEGMPTQSATDHEPREHDRTIGDHLSRYRSLIAERRLHWSEYHNLGRQLGSGGQGVVFLSERRGADRFTLPVALKILSPERYVAAAAYEDAMARMAVVAARVAQIQQDNLLAVHNFVDRNRVRIMVMEWIDGYNLSELLAPQMLERVRQRVSLRRWDYLNNVIATEGPVHVRIKPGIAIAILRGCLGALAALHREEIVHGDVKPSNIMLKRTGTAKLIDIGSAVELDNPPPRRMVTPTYAAPEVLEGASASTKSDLASLGYVLVEMLSGQPACPARGSARELLESKRTLMQRLGDLLPREVLRSELLMRLIRGLVAPDPSLRYASAEAADLDQGAAGVQMQLVKSDLASEYNNEIRLWLEELG